MKLPEKSKRKSSESLQAVNRRRMVHAERLPKLPTLPRTLPCVSLPCGCPSVYFSIYLINW